MLRVGTCCSDPHEGSDCAPGRGNEGEEQQGKREGRAAHPATLIGDEQPARGSHAEVERRLLVPVRVGQHLDAEAVAE